MEFNAMAVSERTCRLFRLRGLRFSGREVPEEIGTMVRDALIDFRDNRVDMPSIKTFEYDEGPFEEMPVSIENELSQAFNPREMTADAPEILRRICGQAPETCSRTLIHFDSTYQDIIKMEAERWITKR